MYSILLYMKTRVTFRMAPDVVASLRGLPNQTQFVENALRDALLDKCAACSGTGRVERPALRVSNFRRAHLAPLTPEAAVHLRRVVGLARSLQATEVDLSPTPRAGVLGFSVARGRDVLVRGTFDGHGTVLGS